VTVARDTTDSAGCEREWLCPNCARTVPAPSPSQPISRRGGWPSGASRRAWDGV